MINYTINRTQNTTTITLPEGTTKYHNKLNNTSYYTNKEEQRIRTHQRSWKTIATVYLDSITIDTETITSETVFTFHLKNTTNNTSIDIPVNNDLADFTTSITSELNPKHFYVVDLDNTSRFQTHFLDFINTVLIELNTNSVVLNELIEDTPVEEPEPVTPQETNDGLKSKIPQTITGQITINDTEYTPLLINKKWAQQQDTRTATYEVVWVEKSTNTIFGNDNTNIELFQTISNLSVTTKYNNEHINNPQYTYVSNTIFRVLIQIPTTDFLDHLVEITFTDQENSENTCTITETTEE